MEPTGKNEIRWGTDDKKRCEEKLMRDKKSDDNETEKDTGNERNRKQEELSWRAL